MKHNFIFEVTLPVPPSVNAMYRRRGGYGMYKTEEANEWVNKCLRKIKKVEPFVREVEVSMYFFFKRETDLDNRIKALLDILQESGVIKNDKQVHSLLAFKEFDKDNPRVEVRVIGE